jgi:capsule polysaccharide export protein KpsC/LpsZ
MAGDSCPVAYGVNFWNRRPLSAIVARRFGNAPRYIDDFDQAADEARRAGVPLIAWSARVSAEQEDRVRQRVAFFRIEDGFIRSVGLGAGLVAGASYVLDSRGIYYDSRRASDLEVLLQTQQLTDEQLERGRGLLRMLVDLRVSKYNLPERTASLPRPADREAVLVVGQVADDASIRSSVSTTLDCQRSPNINRDLLVYARQRHPGAVIAYKPHPDVASGLRRGQIPRSEVGSLADHCLEHTDIVDAIDWCDRVETVSSLAGFEALVRGKAVATHGTPFYAGWGLTEDHGEFARRSRRVGLEAMVYLLLVEYSICYHPAHRRICTPEELIAYLVERRRSRGVRWTIQALTLASRLGRRLGL